MVHISQNERDFQVVSGLDSMFSERFSVSGDESFVNLNKETRALYV